MLLRSRDDHNHTKEVSESCETNTVQIQLVRTEGKRGRCHGARVLQCKCWVSPQPSHSITTCQVSQPNTAIHFPGSLRISQYKEANIFLPVIKAVKDGKYLLPFLGNQLPTRSGSSGFSKSAFSLSFLFIYQIYRPPFLRKIQGSLLCKLFFLLEAGRVLKGNRKQKLPKQHPNLALCAK